MKNISYCSKNPLSDGEQGGCSCVVCKVYPRGSLEFDGQKYLLFLLYLQLMGSELTAEVNHLNNPCMSRGELPGGLERLCMKSSGGI